MEVMVAVQSGTLLHALRVQLKRRVSARRGGDYVFPLFFLYHTSAIFFSVFFVWVALEALLRPCLAPSRVNAWSQT